MPGPLGKITSGLTRRLAARRLRLDPEIFRNKRIMLLGPADTLAEEVATEDFSNFDLIAKMNNALNVPTRLDGQDFYRADVLFHSGELSEASGDTKLNRAKLDRSKTKILVHRTPRRSYLTRTLELERDFNQQDIPVDIRIIDPQFYFDLAGELGGHSPTTGFVASSYLMGVSYAELFIAGFSFFETKYVTNYNTEIDAGRDPMEWALNDQHHNPGLEKSGFATRYRKALKEGRNIRLGWHLENIVSGEPKGGGLRPPAPPGVF